MRRWALLLLIALSPWAAKAELAVDLELVLAVDASGSVDDSEFALQLTGIAAAFRSEEVVEAVREGPLGRIAVALVIWAEHNRPKEISPWVLVQDGQSAEAFAALVERFPRGVLNGATGIGKAIFFSAKAMTDNGYRGARMVVDISGDGRENPPDDWTLMLSDGRAYARGRGVTINGLAILTDDPELDRYYRRFVVMGPGAFVEVAGDYRAFAPAIRRKLIREIRESPAISRLQP